MVFNRGALALKHRSTAPAHRHTAQILLHSIFIHHFIIPVYSIHAPWGASKTAGMEVDIKLSHFNSNKSPKLDGHIGPVPSFDITHGEISWHSVSPAVIMLYRQTCGFAYSVTL